MGTRKSFHYFRSRYQDEINKVKNQIEEAERNTDLQTAAELKYGKLLELEKQLKACQNKEKEIIVY